MAADILRRAVWRHPALGCVFRGKKPRRYFVCGRNGCRCSHAGGCFSDALFKQKAIARSGAPRPFYHGGHVAFGNRIRRLCRFSFCYFVGGLLLEQPGDQ